MELYELIIEDENTDEVYALSLVENPAIEADWVYFTEHKELIKFATVDNDKRTIVAPVLIPDKRIYRMDERTGKEYEVFVTAETIEKLAQQYLMKGYQNKATVEHAENIDGDVTVVESWVSKSSTKDKSANYFTRIFPAGTWFVTMKVNDEKLWQDYVKTGKVKAISIEGLFGHQLVKAASIEHIMDKDINELSEEEALVVLSKIKAVISKDKRYKSKQRVDFETYSDYGDGVKNNAKKGIELNETNGNKCATQTGKVRAQQLAKGEPISVDTIKRMYSYLSRAEVYYDQAESSSDCGNISYLLWGGKAALGWSKNKLRELGLLQENEAQPSIPNASYPGEAASGSIAPALLGDVPPILQDFEAGNMNVFGIETEYFHICPGAVELFTHLVSMPMDEDTKGMVRSAALQADRIFDIEEDVLEDGKAEPKDLGQAIQLVADFKDLMGEIDKITGMEHDVSFMDGHIKVIKELL
jgi:hypothetical protein